MVYFIIFLISFLMIWGLLIQYFSNHEVLKIKGYHSKKDYYMTFIPIYGHYYAKKMPYTNRELNESRYGYVYNREQMLPRIGGTGILLLAVVIVLVPLSIIVYLSLINNAMRTMVVIFALTIILLLNQGLTVDYAKMRGYEGIVIGLIGLIPIASFFIIKHFYPPTQKNTGRRKFKHLLRPKNVLSRILIQGQVALMAVIVIVPVIYIFGMAFSNITSDVPNEIWPSHGASFESFIRLFRDTQFKTWYWNTLKIALINMIFGTVIITGAAYVFARFSFKGKKAGLLSLLVLQAFPSFMGLIAMYVLFWKFGLLGQPTALTILYIGGAIPGNLWLIKGFLDQIPKDLDESAMIDGASKLKIFFNIILPLSIPILTFVAVSMFMGPWMDYMLPGYLLNYMPANAPTGYDVQTQWTLAVGIFNFINDVNNLDYSAFAAAALIVGVPIAVLYMAFQKYLIEGIMAGATKG
ncbi:MAG TPA: sugar ABC transporter permease [Acholeplasmataceae bacterium]|nr:sugar ABC transporter permease [Acholeplasmataceae bacterium]